MMYNVKATPHNYSALITPSDFSLDCIKFCRHTLVCQEILGDITENMQVSSVLRRQPLIVRCCLLMQVILNGGELLYSMLRDINGAIGRLPGCKTTAGIKKMSDDIMVTSKGVIQTMRNIVLEAELENNCELYDEYDDEDFDENFDDEVPDGNADKVDETETITADDLAELVGTIADLLVSGVPISVSADIHVGDLDNDTDEEEN